MLAVKFVKMIMSVLDTIFIVILIFQYKVQDFLSLNYRSELFVINDNLIPSRKHGLFVEYLHLSLNIPLH